MFNEISQKIAQDQHLLPHETLEDGLMRACKAYGSNDEHTQRLYEYVTKQWFFFASPVLANAPDHTGSSRGLPISCFLNYVEDSRDGILGHYTENGWLTSNGGGIGGYWGGLRSIGQRTSRGLRTTGLIPFIHVADAQMLAFNQGDTRRGAYAAYIDVSHPEILEFLYMRKPSGGDIHRKNFNIHHGVCIDDKFMTAVNGDLDYALIDPHTDEVVEKVRARDIWAKIIELRLETGEPYLFFKDTANDKLPKALKDLGLKINHSNLCTEIMLPTNKDRTAVCCLSSLNAAKYDEWKGHNQFIYDVMEMLDNVLEDFINRAPKGKMWRATQSAYRERSVGLGLMGFHTYLQSKMIPFDSAAAIGITRNIFNKIWKDTEYASYMLGRIRGVPPDLVGTGNRFGHRIAIAPNATSSLVCNLVSPSIEPINSNSFIQKTKTMNFTWRNQELMKHIGTPEENPEIWKSIHNNNGSVQHLDLNQTIKDVFKTAFEIDQNWVIEHAKHRQDFIDQGQSINLFFTNNDPLKYINQVHMSAWESGLKSLYYVRSEAIRRPENISEQIERSIRSDATECVACEG